MCGGGGASCRYEGGGDVARATMSRTPLPRPRGLRDRDVWGPPAAAFLRGGSVCPLRMYGTGNVLSYRNMRDRERDGAPHGARRGGERVLTTYILLSFSPARSGTFSENKLKLINFRVPVRYSYSVTIPRYPGRHERANHNSHRHPSPFSRRCWTYTTTGAARGPSTRRTARGEPSGTTNNARALTQANAGRQ